MADRPEVIVVGAGIVGSATALALAQAGAKVVVLEAAFPAAGVTGAAMGHVVVMDDSPAQLALTAYSRRLWTTLAPELPAACADSAPGTTWVAATEGELAEARRRAAGYQAAGIDCQVLDAWELAVAEPGLRPGLAGGLHVPGDRVLYPPAVTRWLLTQARMHGATVREGCPVVSLERGGVRLHSGTLSADVVINAAGPAAATLVPGLPIQPRRGHLVITQRYPGLCRSQLVELGYVGSTHVARGPAVAFNIQPRPNGQLLIGSSRELVGLDPAINRSLLGQMVARAISYLPALAHCQALRTWVGFRPSVSDHLPLIGPWPAHPGTWIAAGHEGLGITTALGTAHLLADLLLGRAPAIDPAPFRPDRPVPEFAA